MKQLQPVIFFIGWVLSPLTTWNDWLINVPLSYLIANFFYALIRLPFQWLLVLSYLFTNVLGLAMMYWSGKKVIVTAENKWKGALTLIANTALLAIAAYWLDKSGWLKPLGDSLSRIAQGQ